MISPLKFKRLSHSNSIHAIPLNYKKLSQDRECLSRSQISTKFARQLSNVFRNEAQISINSCQLLFQTWYEIVILFSEMTLTSNEESFITSVERTWMSTTERHSSVSISDQLSETHNINANKRSVHTYHELSSLSRSENDVLLILAWSSDCHDRALLTLRAWAISEDGKRLYLRLVRDLCSEKAPAQIMLSLVIFVFLLRLLPYGFDKPSAEANYLWNFLSLLKDFPCNNIRAILKCMIWFVWMAISPGVNVTEGQKIFRILAHVVDSPEFVLKRDDEHSIIYWKRRFNSLRINDETLSIIPEILEKLEITTTSALSAKEETSTHIKSQAASDRFIQTEESESSRDLLRRMKEKDKKKRGCWGAWWSSEVGIWSVLCWEVCLHSIIWVDRQLILMSIIILMNQQKRDILLTSNDKVSAVVSDFRMFSIFGLDVDICDVWNEYSDKW